MSAKNLPFICVIILALAGIMGTYLYIQNTANTVTIISPLRGPAVQAVYATGTVEPVVMFPVSPRTTSRLMELLADEGQQVTKDTLLARMEDTDLKTSLTEAKARVELARNNFNRIEGLVDIGGVSREAFDQAKTELESAQANVANIEANLSYMTLLAPDNGTVVRRDGEIGELITAGQNVFWLAGEAMRIEAEVDEEDIALVQPGQKVLIHADAFPEEIFEGKVQSITPKGDPVARSYRVRIMLDDNTKLMIGMTAESNIIIREEQNALLIPASAVENGHVWTIENGKPHQTKINIGAEGINAIEVLSGITLEDKVIQDPPVDLQEDDNIHIESGTWELP